EDDAPTAPEVVGTAPVALPTPQGTFLTRAWRELDSEGRPGIEHRTLETPTPSAEAPSAGGSAGPSPHETSSPEAPSAEAPLVRVHSECLTGDAFGSHRCDCGEQLETSLDLVARHGGVVVYVRGHEGR